MMELLYFSDISQLNDVIKTRSELLKEMRPVTGDMFVSFELERLKIAFIDEWDYIEDSEIEKHWKDASRLSSVWWDEVMQISQCDELPLFDASKQDMVYSFEACLNARMIYRRIFATYSIKKISGCFLPEVAVIRTGPAPTARAVRSVSEAVLLYMAEKNNIPVEKLASISSLSSGKASFRAIVTSGVKKSEGVEQLNKARKVVLIYKEGFADSEYMALVQAFEKSQEFHLISISRQDLELGRPFIHSQVELEKQLQFFWEMFLKSVENYHGNYPEIFANNHLLFQFKAIWHEMKSAASYGHVFAGFLDLMKPSIVVFAHDIFTIERTLLKEAQNRELLTMSLLHGGLRYKFSSLGLVGDADLIFLWNDVDRKTLESYGVEKCRLNNIGSIRYEKDYKTYLSAVEPQLCSQKEKAKARLNLNSSKPLISLLTAEVNTGLACPVANPNKHREAIRDLIALIESRPDLQFIIKPHPSYDYYDLYKSLINPRIPNLYYTEQSSLNEILEASDVCLMMNYFTTAGLEAMLCRVPVIYLNSAVYPLDYWRDGFSEVGMHRLASVADLEKSIDSLLTDSAVRREALADADKLIKEIIDVNKSLCTDRMLKIIRWRIGEGNTSDEEIFLNVETMRNFLYSNDIDAAKEFSQRVKRCSGDQLIYVFTYLAGRYDLGFASIFRIFEVFHHPAENKMLKSWYTARWLLMPVYITAIFGRSCFSEGMISKLKLFVPYLLHPSKISSVPALFWRNVGKYFIKHSFFYKAILITLAKLRK